LKHAPLKDLCELGGWKNAQTILKSYQQADHATMRQALATRQRTGLSPHSPIDTTIDTAGA
jgi:hypothetical protein